MITEYDPNIRWSKHTFELTFMQWDYSLKVEVDVGGNCRGADLFKSAIRNYFDDNCWDDAVKCGQIILKRPAKDPDDTDDEDTLEIDLENEDDLMDICVGVCITKHVKEQK